MAQEAAEAVGGAVELSQGVVVEGVHSQLSDHDVRLEGPDYRFEDGLEGSDEHVVRRVGQARDVDRVAEARAHADLVLEARLRVEEPARLVDAGGEDLVGVVEDELHAVAVVGVYVHIGDPLAPLDEPHYSDGGIV